MPVVAHTHTSISTHIANIFRWTEWKDWQRKHSLIGKTHTHTHYVKKI